MSEAEIISEIITNSFYESVKKIFDVKTQKTSTNFIITINDFPVWAGGRDSVIIALPSSFFVKDYRGARFKTELFSRDVKIIEARTGRGFVSPHIWANGTPCWNNQSVKGIDFFAKLFEALFWIDATETNYDVGHPTPDTDLYRNHMGKENMLAAYKKYKNRLKKELQLSDSFFNADGDHKYKMSIIRIISKTL